jgi:hypothetical protein
MNKQIVTQITLKFPHHANFSGYDNILFEADWIKSFNLLDYQFYYSYSEELHHVYYDGALPQRSSTLGNAPIRPS